MTAAPTAVALLKQVPWDPDSAASWATRRGLREFSGRGAPMATAQPRAAAWLTDSLHGGVNSLRQAETTTFSAAGWPEVGVSDASVHVWEAAPGALRSPTSAVLSQARPRIQVCVVDSAVSSSRRCSYEEEGTPILSVSSWGVSTKWKVIAVASMSKRLRWVYVTELEACADPTLCMGAAASGRRTCWAGAQPRSYTYAPTSPARAMVGAAGSGVLWPCPVGGRPSPWVIMAWWRMSSAVVRCLATTSGHCRCNRTTDASLLEAVGRAGFGGLGFRMSRAAIARSVSCSCGTRTGMLAPTSPFPGSCGLYQSSEASVAEAVGCSGIGLLGAWRGMVATTFAVEAVIVMSVYALEQLSCPVRRPVLAALAA